MEDIKMMPIRDKVLRRSKKQQRRRVSRTVQALTLVFKPGRLYSLPLPSIYKCFFTAQGFCYTGSGAGTGDYNWSIPINNMRFPFSGMTSGLTWNNLTPASYNPVGFSTLLNGSLYINYVVEGATFFLDIVPQSVSDSVTATISPSTGFTTPASVAAALTVPWTKQMTFASGRVYRMGDYSFRVHYEMPTLLGVSPDGYMNDLSGKYTGTYNSSPSVDLYAVLNVETGDNAILGSALEVKVKVVYHVKLWNLNTAAMT